MISKIFSYVQTTTIELYARISTKYETFVDVLQKHENEAYEKWSEKLEEVLEEGLKQSILTYDQKSSKVKINFDPQVLLNYKI